MILNIYEENVIGKKNLPITWQSQKILDELEEYLQNNWKLRSVFFEDRKIESRQQFLGFTSHQGIRTKKYVGTIVFKGEQLNIFPKMFRTESDDHDIEGLSQKHLMRNLIRWIEYCNRISFPFINISSELMDVKNFRELFVTIYVGYVKEAINRGMFYQYVEETKDISNIKGRFDATDYLINKIPNGMGNKFRCTYSNFEVDNWVNRIIKYTCKYLYNTTSRKNQRVIRNVLMKMNNISDVKCTYRDCDRVRLGKVQHYYRTILSMSKILLLNKTSNYTMDINESFCFLFPTDLLFEGFISGFIKDIIEEYGGKVSLQKSEMHLIEDIQYAGQSLGAAFTIRQDIVVEFRGKNIVLDAKYKQVSRFEGDKDEVKKIVSEEPKQTDIYQVCEYARKRNISDVYLLYPMYRYERNEPCFPVGKSQGKGGNINIHFIRLPFIFEEDENILKEQLKAVIFSIFSI